MTGTPLSRLKLPAAEHDPARICADFETHEFAVTEDRKRITCVRRALKKRSSLIDPERAHSLVRRLELLTDPDFQDFLSEVESNSLASKVLARDIRRANCGAILSFLEEHDCKDIGALTLVDYRQIVPASRLVRINLREWTGEFRRQIYRLLPKGWGGALFAFWEGEYEPNRGQWQFHLHIIATGDVLAAVRDYIAMERREIVSKSDTINSPSHFSDLAGLSIGDIAGWVTYMLKLEPKARLISVPKDGSRPVRSRRDHYMADDVKASYWLFLDRVEVRDLIVLIGVKPSQNGFISTRGLERD